VKKFLIFIASGFLLFAVYRVLYQTDNPVFIGENISELDIPSGANVIRFERESNEFNGDGYLLIALSVKQQGFKELQEQCFRQGYLKFDTGVFEREPALLSYYNRNDVGFYKVIAETADTFSISLLNSSKKTLVIYSINR
jgi:hypothetical protein